MTVQAARAFSMPRSPSSSSKVTQSVQEPTKAKPRIQQAVKVSRPGLKEEICDPTNKAQKGKKTRAPERT
jgi:hypothetical protein